MTHSPIPPSIQRYLTQKSTLQQFFQFIGDPIYHHSLSFSHFFVLSFKILKRLPEFSRWRTDRLFSFLWEHCISSLPVILLCTAFAGVLLTHQIAWHMDLALHDVSMIPGFSGQFILREMGVIIPSALLVARSGAATTAELASMKVSEQIDALKLLGIDIIHYLVLPRLVASCLAATCLTLIAVTTTLSCSLLVAVTQYGFSTAEFLNSLRHFVTWKDLCCAILKGFTFGILIPIISCSYGLQAKEGAAGVGAATTQAVVVSTLAIIVFDFILTFLFQGWLSHGLS